MKAVMTSVGGNALFMIMIAIFLIGLLSKTMVEKDLDVTNFARASADKAQVADIISHATNLKSGINNLLSQGVDPVDMDFVTPDDETPFNTAPHGAKMYHPYGGGVQYYENYNGWNNIIIHRDAEIQDVGPTDDPEILAVGEVSAELCTALAQNNSPATASMAALNDLRNNTPVTLAEGATCTSGLCDAVVSHCLVSPDNSVRVFYFLLLAR